MIHVHLRGTGSQRDIAELVIDRFPCVVGRDPGCDQRVEAMTVSRRHCCFFLRDEEVRVRDLESRNGTYVNGERLTASRAVYSGDKVGVGPVGFRVVLDHLEPADR